MEKALIVVDMQNDFVDGALGTKEAVRIVPMVKEKIAAAVKQGKAVYFTMDTHGEDYLQTQEGKRLPVKHCIRQSSGWKLHPEIECAAKELEKAGQRQIVFEKNIFGSEQLAQALRKALGNQSGAEIEIVGLCTDICVISNALLLKTLMPEADVIVDASCCAGVTPESHGNALNAMKMCQITILNE